MTQIFDLGSRRRETDESGTRVDETRHASEDAGDDRDDPALAKDAPLRARGAPTRVPVVFERELRRVAEVLRVPLTNLLRAVLEDAVAVADHAGENVESRLKTFASSLEQERDKLRRRVRRDPLEGIFAFQPIKLAQTASCAKCKRDLRRGESANLGLRDEPGARRVFVCDACVPAE